MGEPSRRDGHNAHTKDPASASLIVVWSRKGASCCINFSAFEAPFPCFSLFWDAKNKKSVSFFLLPYSLFFNFPFLVPPFLVCRKPSRQFHVTYPLGNITISPRKKWVVVANLEDMKGLSKSTSRRWDGTTERTAPSLDSIRAMVF